MENYIDVEPSNLVQVISKIKINVLHLHLNVMATIQVVAYSADNQQLASYCFELVSPEYDDWHDDDWLVDYVCQKYGFQIQAPTEL